ncbi:MAG: hypothetical protein RL616_935 [Verrucomicrobiota bacterium]|jgi:DNA-binding NtrC family response regulator
MTATYAPQFKPTSSASALLPRQPNPRQRILVVDDDVMIRRLNTEVLTCHGYQVDAAEDGDIAWDAIQENNYDLLVTDQNMPKVTGVGLLKKLHAARLALPVILATGTFPHEELAAHPWLQIDAALLKPYTYDQLLTTVKNVLYASAGDAEEFAAPPNWSGGRAANHLRF